MKIIRTKDPPSISTFCYMYHLICLTEQSYVVRQILFIKYIYISVIKLNNHFFVNMKIKN